MLAGDLIVKIDNNDVGADLGWRHHPLRGPSGSSVKLTVRRAGTGELLDFSLRRAKVDVRSVTHTTLDPGYGYVRITSFSETTADDVAAPSPRSSARTRRVCTASCSTCGTIRAACSKRASRWRMRS